jgi:hypothetical protein
VLSKLRSYRPSHGTVVAYLALFVALGGTSYGIARNSVGTRAIANNSVRTQDIRNRTIRNRDIKPEVIDNSRIKNSDLIANFAANASALGGVGASGYLRRGARVFERNGATKLDFADLTNLATLSLGPGQYLVLAEVDINSDAGQTQVKHCFLSVPGPNDDDREQALSKAGSDSGALNLTYSLMAGFSSGSPSTVTLRCRQLVSNFTDDAVNPRIVAVKLD